MVLEDVYQSETDASSSPLGVSKPNLSQIFSEIHLATPLDRVAAWVIDLMLLTPLIALLTSPFKRQWVLAQVLGEKDQVYFWCGGYLIFAFLTVLVYQSLLTHYWGGSLGKKVLGLEVRQLWSREKPKLGQAFWRSLLCFFDALLMLPLLSLFSDEMRRTHHDRASDTLVVQKNPKKSVAAPHWREKSLVRGVQWGVLTTFLIVGSQLMMSYGSHLGDKGFFAGVTSEEKVVDGHCSFTNSSVNRALSEAQDAESRMQRALALYASQSIGSRCLDQEVEKVFWGSQNDKSRGLLTAYLGKAFVLMEEEGDESDNYLNRVCRESESSVHCQFVQVLQAAPSVSAARTTRSFMKLLSKADIPDYIRIWGVQHFFEAEQYDLVVAETERLSHVKAFEGFVEEKKLKAYRRQGEIDQSDRLLDRLLAKAVFRNPADSIQLSSWACYEDASADCRASRGCEFLMESIEKYPQLLAKDEIAFSYIRSEKCETGEWLEPKDVLSQNAQEFLAIVHDVSGDGRESWAQTHWKKVLLHPGPSTIYKKELMQWVVNRSMTSSSIKELSQLQEIWLQVERDRNWLRWGEQLQSLWRQRQANDRADEVVSEIQRFKVSQWNEGPKRGLASEARSALNHEVNP